MMLNYIEFVESQRSKRRVKSRFNIRTIMIDGPGEIIFYEPEDEKRVRIYEAILDSMTEEERSGCLPLDDKRKERIADGSGIGIQAVQEFFNSYEELTTRLSPQVSRDLPGLLDLLITLATMALSFCLTATFPEHFVLTVLLPSFIGAILLCRKGFKKLIQ
ncbi:hypothetical protein ACVWZB_004790 [Paenibacillus polymyxa]